MALLFTSAHSSLLSTNPNKPFPLLSSFSPNSLSSLSFPNPRTRALRLRSLRLRSSLSDENSDSLPRDILSGAGDILSGAGEAISDAGEALSDATEVKPKVTDEWGEEAEPESVSSKLADLDPAKDEDEWGGDGFVGGIGNVSALKQVAETVEEVVEEVEEVVEEVVDVKLLGLKRSLVDTVYGTELGFRASVEERAEILELVNQLEALNPTPSPTSSPELLDGNWVLLYTGFSELLPLLAVGSTPLLKVDKITQSIDTGSLTIVNSTKLSSTFSNFSFSASATFEVRSPSRIQVQFKEGSFQPPEIKFDLPGEVDVFGRKINMSPLQQTLNPLQEAVANISRSISGQPPLKIPIPGDRNSSWLLITYLDADFRISRGDGGLFVLAKEGINLLNQ